MKKIMILVLTCLLLCSCQSKTTTNSDEVIKNEEPVTEKNNYVSYNGKLKVSGTSLVNQYDEPLVLHGMSSHGLQWYSQFINKENLTVLKEEWNTNVFRLAMYTEENGYISNPSIGENILKQIDLVISEDMYVIVDWHILSDGNPKTHLNEALTFFEKISKKYANDPHVIYEICNEPNGNVSWDNDIKPYADQVISVIRSNSKDAIIIVGTSTWSQDVLDPISNPIEDKNVLYALHFYAGTHTDWLRQRVQQALDSGLPIFVSEWGTSAADGNGGVYLEESQKWIDFMNEKNISWCNWSLSDKNESSALLKPGATTNGFTDDDLSESGKFIKQVLID